MTPYERYFYFIARRGFRKAGNIVRKPEFLGLTQQYNEQELILALKARNPQAFGYLYDNYSSSLYSIILQIVQNTAVANDVLQEVFMNIWRRIETYDATKGKLFTWMLNISRNASIDLLRSRDYKNNLKNQELKDNVHQEVQSTQISTDAIGLRKFLTKLRPDHRVLIELFYFKGYTQDEISEIEGVPLGTVKTRIRNALLQLREFLK